MHNTRMRANSAKWRVLACLVAVLFVGVSGAGCGDDDPGSPLGEKRVVMPLDVGNTWHYAKISGEPGAPRIPMSRTIREHREVTIGGRPVTVAVDSPVSEEAGTADWKKSRLLRNEADGLYYFGTLDDKRIDLFSSPLRLAPLDGRAGEGYGFGVTPMVCVAADSLVSTGFGEVVADVYYIPLDEGTIIIPDIYVVPGIGINFFSYNSEYSIWLVGYDFGD